MHQQSRPNPPLPRKFYRPLMWLAFLFISIPPVLQLWGCAGGTQNDGGFFSSLFGQSPTPTDTPTPTICATPTVTPTPEATESERSHRKAAKPHNPGESATPASPNPTATGSVTLEPSSSSGTARKRRQSAVGDLGQRRRIDSAIGDCHSGAERSGNSQYRLGRRIVSVRSIAGGETGQSCRFD